MAVEVEFRFPSKIPYAYVGVRGTPEEIAKIDPEALASLFANAMYSFGKTERQAIDLIARPQAPAPEPVSKPVAQGGDDSLAEADRLIVESLGGTKVAEVTKAPAKLKPWEKPKPKPAGGTVVDVDFF